MPIWTENFKRSQNTVEVSSKNASLIEFIYVARLQHYCRRVQFIQKDISDSTNLKR
jgi:hypothetical protein